jgi:hypothetical protein
MKTNIVFKRAVTDTSVFRPSVAQMPRDHAAEILFSRSKLLTSPCFLVLNQSKGLANCPSN